MAIDDPMGELQRRYERGELAYQVTADGAAVFPPRLRAPGTGGPLTWKVSGGAGEVYATTVVRPRNGNPRNLALIDLDDGFRMMSKVVGCPPDEVAIGMRVRVDFEPGGVPVFRPR